MNIEIILFRRLSINQYKDKYLLTHLDFREFANDFVYNYEDNCGERVRFFMDELVILYTYYPHFFGVLTLKISKIK
jgi:hypothetical protein